MNGYKVVIETEFATLSLNKISIGLVMMVKNEEERILVSLKSVIGIIDAIIIYDTGSTDKTMSIIQNFCAEHKINLYMIQGDFIDFATSRNILLGYADKINVQYLLLLDGNDQLRGGNFLKEFIQNSSADIFFICQEWWSGALDKFYNIRLIKTRTGYKYTGSVHETINTKNAQPVLRLPDNIVIYQDRTKDNGKSKTRYKRDYELLIRDYEKDMKNTRTLFYLAQTCMCLHNYEEALKYSKLRIDLEGFQEERFLSFIRAGDCCLKLNHSWYDALTWYTKAYEHSQRVEPLVKIADHYRDENKWYIAYMYIHEACSLHYPKNAILFVDKSAYDYCRWHVMSVVATHVNKIDEGKKACLQALKTSPNRAIDKDIWKYYKLNHI